MRARLYTDGGARGNPGPAAYGYVLEDETGAVLAQHGETIGVATNNVAEYCGLIAGLEKAAELQVDGLEVVSDSELMVKQMRGEYRVKNAALRELQQRGRRPRARARRGVVYARAPRAQRARRPARQRSAGRRVTVHPFRAAIETGDESAAFATLAPDVVFRSPAVYKPYEGRDVVASPARGRGQDVRELSLHERVARRRDDHPLLRGARSAIASSRAIDILEHDADGLVARFTVMVRPLSGLQALSAAVAARIEAG